MLDCNTLVFASLSQTTLLRSYTIDTMNDNTNILLGGGELLLTHTEDEARFQITPGSCRRGGGSVRNGRAVRLRARTHARTHARTWCGLLALCLSGHHVPPGHGQ